MLRMLRVGFGRTDIAPPLEAGLRMAGNQPWPRPLGVARPLQARMLLADDGQARVAIVCLDLLALPAADVATLRGRLAAAGGLEPDAILVACSHTHRAPFTHLVGAAAAAEVFGYLDAIYPRLVDAMASAAAGLRPARFVTGRATAPGWAFNRRPIYAGGEVGTHGPARGDGFVGMEDAPDDEVRVLAARRPDGAVLGGLVGFACHPTVMEDEPVYSADYPGALTAELEARHGGSFGFLLGASGDVAPPDAAGVEPRHGFGPAHARAMGRALAERAGAALAAARPLPAARVAFATTHRAIPQRRPTAEQVDLARWYLEEAPPGLDERAFTRRLTGHDYTFHDGRPPSNAHHVRESWACGSGSGGPASASPSRRSRSRRSPSATSPSWPFRSSFSPPSVGASPFPDTLVASPANGWHGYAPSREPFTHGGYETRLAYGSRLAPEAGDRLTDAPLELLRSLAGRA